ncbi:hypothetical protein MBANPS3_000575 [Mucor bainieri]
MWPSLVGILNDSAMAFAPLMYWIVFGAAMAYYCIKYPLYRNMISYICLLACAFGIVASIISVMVVAWDVKAEESAFFFFYGLYITFAFLPSVFAFYTREKRTKQSNAGKYTTYFGFLWAAACILGSLATTIMAAIITHQSSLIEDGDLLVRLSGGLFFVILMNWGFVAVLLLLALIYVKRLTQQYAQGSFLVYVVLHVLSALVFTLTGFAPNDVSFSTIDSLGYLDIFLVDLPIAIAVFIAFHMAHRWIGDNQGNSISNDTQSHQAQQQHRSADTNSNDGSKYELSNNLDPKNIFESNPKPT